MFAIHTQERLSFEDAFVRVKSVFYLVVPCAESCLRSPQAVIFIGVSAWPFTRQSTAVHIASDLLHNSNHADCRRGYFLVTLFLADCRRGYFL